MSDPPLDPVIVEGVRGDMRTMGCTCIPDVERGEWDGAFAVMVTHQDHCALRKPPDLDEI